MYLNKDLYMNVHTALFASGYPVFPGSFVEKTLLSPLNCLRCQRLELYLCVSISGQFILFP